MTEETQTMMVELLQETYQRPNPKMPNWSKIISYIPPTFSPELLPYAQTHDAVVHKVAFADYHYHILNQLYRPFDTPAVSNTPFWARAEMHSIVFNLYSALDSLGYEINVAYELNLKQREIDIYHNHKQFTARCLRCELSATQPTISKFIETELAQHWFEEFNHLRNMIAHKNLPVINFYVGGTATHIMIPDDPLNTNPQYGDFTRQLEINQYCKDLRNRVINVIEQSYAIIEPTAKQYIDDMLRRYPRT